MGVIIGDYQILLKTLQGGGQKVAKRAVFLVMNKMETQAKKNAKTSIYATTPPKAPFSRTGKLQQSIIGQRIGDGLSARVYVGVDYARYVEEGTGIYHRPGARKPYWTTFGGLIGNPVYIRGTKPKPFWVPAREATEKATPGLIEKAVKDIMSKNNIK